MSIHLLAIFAVACTLVAGYPSYIQCSLQVVADKVSAFQNIMTTNQNIMGSPPITDDALASISTDTFTASSEVDITFSASFSHGIAHATAGTFTTSAQFSWVSGCSGSASMVKKSTSGSTSGITWVAPLVVDGLSTVTLSFAAASGYGTVSRRSVTLNLGTTTTTTTTTSTTTTTTSTTTSTTTTSTTTTTTSNTTTTTTSNTTASTTTTTTSSNTTTTLNTTRSTATSATSTNATATSNTTRSTATTATTTKTLTTTNTTSTTSTNTTTTSTTVTTSTTTTNRTTLTSTTTSTNTTTITTTTNTSTTLNTTVTAAVAFHDLVNTTGMHNTTASPLAADTTATNTTGKANTTTIATMTTSTRIRSTNTTVRNVSITSSRDSTASSSATTSSIRATASTSAHSLTTTTMTISWSPTSTAIATTVETTTHFLLQELQVGMVFSSLENLTDEASLIETFAHVVGNATGRSIDAVVVTIESFTVQMAYSNLPTFDSNFTLSDIVAALAVANNVSINMVSVTVISSRRLQQSAGAVEHRRLASTVSAEIRLTDAHGVDLVVKAREVVASVSNTTLLSNVLTSVTATTITPPTVQTAPSVHVVLASSYLVSASSTLANATAWSIATDLGKAVGGAATVQSFAHRSTSSETGSPSPSIASPSPSSGIIATTTPKKASTDAGHAAHVAIEIIVLAFAIS